ncbi:RnfH family protein [Aromatoleum sp.]|uniref:RnfH family protein n=1 Tax=Aromatoleum sp. TaxID=2307007 RepID=UPI002FC6EE50
MADLINVEVSYALSHVQEVLKVGVPAGATVRDAIEASGILRKYPEIELDGRNKVGVFAKLTRLDTPLRDRDRVEIYRPLIADPKAVRKKRAEEGKVMKKGGAAGGEE